MMMFIDADDNNDDDDDDDDEDDGNINDEMDDDPMICAMMSGMSAESGSMHGARPCVGQRVTKQFKPKQIFGQNK